MAKHRPTILGQLAPALCAGLLLASAHGCAVPQSHNGDPTRAGTLMPSQTAPHETETPAKETPLPSSVLVLLADAGWELYLEDPGTGAVSRLADRRVSWKPIRWEDHGCALLVSDQNGDILQVNLQGEVADVLFNIDDLHAKGWDPFDRNVALSEDGKWIWFWEASGEPSNEIGEDLRLERQNIVVYSQDLGEGPFQVSSNGGAYTARWSPDSKSIAYSDYDNRHVHQVFVSSRTGGAAQQVSAFDEPSYFDEYQTGIDQIEWSPSGTRIAVDHFQDGSATIAVFPTVHDEEFEGFSMEKADVLWWLDDRRLVARVGASGGEGIYLIDVIEGSLEQRTSPASFPMLQWVFPYVRPDLVGFFSGHDFFVLDLLRDNIVPLPRMKPTERAWPLFTTPQEFRGAASCG